MIILKIIGVLLLIILILLVIAVFIPIYVGIKYDKTVTLEVKCFFVRFIREFGGESAPEAKQNFAHPTVFDRISASVKAFFKKLHRSSKRFFAALKSSAKRVYRKISRFVRNKLKVSSARDSKKKRRNSGKGKSSRVKVKEENLFASLRKERGFWGALKFFVELGRTLGGGTVRMYKGISAEKFVLKVKIVGEDAADTAIKYGEVCSVAFPMLSFLLSNMRNYKRDIEITPDFDGNEGSIYFDGGFKIFPFSVIGHALWAVIDFAIKQIKFTLYNKKKKVKG